MSDMHRTDAYTLPLGFAANLLKRVLNVASSSLLICCEYADRAIAGRDPRCKSGPNPEASRIPGQPQIPNPKSRIRSAKDVLDHEPHIRRPLGEATHVPGEPVLAVRDQHANTLAVLGEPQLQRALDAVEHGVFVRRGRHAVIDDEP